MKKIKLTKMDKKIKKIAIESFGNTNYTKEDLEKKEDYYREVLGEEKGVKIKYTKEQKEEGKMIMKNYKKNQDYFLGIRFN